MAAEYPYVLTPDAFRDFVTKLKTVGVPDKVNKQFIASLGFKSSNHQKFPGVLKFVGLVDSAGKPTQEYRAALRDPKSGPGALAGYIREAYSGLFDVYTDAHRKDDEALRNFFAARTDLGDRAVKAMVDTFQVLCSFADFAGVEVGAALDGPKPEVPAAASGPATSTMAPVVINVNLQLELPSTSDQSVYDALFGAMAKHLLDRART